jgi:hypothetical protein
MTSESNKNYLNHCRCCLKIFNGSQKQIKISRDIKNKFHRLTSLQITSSKLLPKNICSLCNNLLDFFETCRDDFMEKHRKLEELVERTGRKKTTEAPSIANEVLVKIEPMDVKDEAEDPVSIYVETTHSIPPKNENLDSDYKPIPLFLFDDRCTSEDELALPHQKKTQRPKKKKKIKFACPEEGCKRYFLEKQNLEDHVNFNHLGIHFQCDFCDFKTSTRDLLKLHTNRMHGDSTSKDLKKEQCPECGIFVCGLGSHIKQVHEKEKHQIKCDICGFGTFALHIIRRHMYSSHFPKELKKRVSCPICGKLLIASSGDSALKAHLKLVHSKQKRVKCFCGLTYKSEQYLRNHQKIVHEKRFKRHHCKICDKDIINASQYKEHIYKHKVDGRKEWACDICGKLYGSESLMLGHQVFHQEPKFLCTYDGCDKKFHRRPILRRHIKVKLRNHGNHLKFDE